ncbi:MAG: hypothetical protein ACYCWE_05815 [Eubacteriales bacterium]
MKIYSYDLIGEDTLNIDHHLLNDLGLDLTFRINYDPNLVVNMNFEGQGQNKANAQGWQRDQNYYFNNLLNNYPEAFSERNKKLIKEGRVPLCDQKFTDVFNEFRGYEGNKLIHHHIGGDGQAVALPQDLHVGTGGVHIAEKRVGIYDLTKNFSDKVQSDYENQISFDWNDAEEYYNNIIDKKEIVDDQSQNHNNFDKPITESNKPIKHNSNDKIETNSKSYNKRYDPPRRIKYRKLQNRIIKTNDFKIKINPQSAIKATLGVVAATASVIVLAKNQDKATSILKGALKLLHKSKPVVEVAEKVKVMEVVEKVIDVVENMDVNKTFENVRKSPVLHQVRDYIKKNGIKVKGYPRGK